VYRLRVVCLQVKNNLVKMKIEVYCNTGLPMGRLSYLDIVRFCDSGRAEFSGTTGRLAQNRR